MSATEVRVIQPRHAAAPVCLLARACPLTINLTINRGDPEELPHVA